MDLDDPQQVGVAFATVIPGCEVSDGPPPPDSPLGRILAFAAEHGDDSVTPEHRIAAREGRPLLP